MSFLWPFLLPAVVLLFFPLDVFLSPDRFRLRDYGEANRAFWWPLFTLDPLRAWAGTWLLVKAIVVSESREDLWPYMAPIVILAVLGAALMAQVYTRRDEEAVLAPIGYIAGVIVALLPPMISLPGVVLAFLAMIGFRRLGAYFVGGVLGLLVAGGVSWSIHEFNYHLVVACALMITPPILSFLFHRLLAAPVRRTA